MNTVEMSILLEQKDIKMSLLLAEPVMQDILNIARDEGYGVETSVNWCIQIMITSTESPMCKGAEAYQESLKKFKHVTENMIERIKQNYDNTLSTTYFEDRKHEIFKIIINDI